MKFKLKLAACGCRFITVDTYCDAIPFYTKNGIRTGCFNGIITGCTNGIRTGCFNGIITGCFNALKGINGVNAFNAAGLRELRPRFIIIPLRLPASLRFAACFASL